MKMRFDAGSLMMVDDERVKAAIDLNLRQLSQLRAAVPPASRGFQA